MWARTGGRQGQVADLAGQAGSGGVAGRMVGGHAERPCSILRSLQHILLSPQSPGRLQSLALYKFLTDVSYHDNQQSRPLHLRQYCWTSTLAPLMKTKLRNCAGTTSTPSCTGDHVGQKCG